MYGSSEGGRGAHTETAPLSLALRAFGSLTAIPSARKTSPRGGQPEGDCVSPEPGDQTAPYPSHPPGNLNLLGLEKNETHVKAGS